MSYPYEVILKFIIIGDAGVGKSCLLHYFTEKRFTSESQHTIGVEFGTKILEVKGKKVKLQIWDTAGQERFRAVCRSYYRGAACTLLVYDITNRESFNHAVTWLSDARNLTSPNTVFMLVGSKCDMNDARAVQTEEAQKFAAENGLLFMETSSKDGTNVEEAFIRNTERVLDAMAESGMEMDPQVKTDAKIYPEGTDGNANPDESSGSGGCSC